MSFVIKMHVSRRLTKGNMGFGSVESIQRCCAALGPVRPNSDPLLCQPCAEPDGDGSLFNWDAMQPGQESIGDLPIVGRDRDPMARRSAKTGMPGMPVPLPSPKSPSLRELELHNLTHLPYAAWCPYCVSGRRPNSHHRRCRSVSTKQRVSAGDG